MARSARVLVDWSGRETGVNVAALNASNNSNWIPVNGGTTLELNFTHANTTGALTITMALQLRELGYLPGESVGGTMTTKSRQIAAGTETLNNRTISNTVAGAENWKYTCLVEGGQLRVSAITAAGAAATDTITMTARVIHGG
jgi:hypothetical protein